MLPPNRTAASVGEGQAREQRDSDPSLQNNHSALAPAFPHQPHTTNLHSGIHPLAHVINGQSAYGHRRKSLHLHSSLSQASDPGYNLHTVTTLLIQSEFHLDIS